MKYNIALVPVHKGEQVVAQANVLSKIADSYLLGEHSLPHVTLYQFETHEDDINSIWNKTCDKLSHVLIELTFTHFSCITFDQKTFWVSLIPNKRDLLIQMHKQVVGILNQPVKKNYDPHMTLINTKDHSCHDLVNKLAEHYSPIQDHFMLALGRSDHVGQFIEKKIILRNCQKRN